MASEIVVDGEVINLPADLIKDPSVLPNILTLSTWDNQLNAEQRNDLLKMLPLSLTERENMETVRKENAEDFFRVMFRMLLSGENLAAFDNICTLTPSGNPINEMAVKLSKGHYSAEAYQLRRCHTKANKAKQRLLKHQYYHSLLKEVIVSRQCHLHAARRPGKYYLSRCKTVAETSNISMDAKSVISASRLYNKILRDVDAEARTRLGLGPEPLALSDSDTEDQAPTHKLSSSTTIAPNRIKELLLQHKRRREAKVNTPDLNVMGIKLSDVVSRTYAGSRKMQGISTKKRKREENLKIAKKRMKCGAAGTRSKPTAQNQRRSAKGKHSHSKSNKFATTPSCFFELLRDVMLLSQDKTTLSITQLALDWLSSAEASLYLWTTKCNNWKEVLPSALKHMGMKQEVGSYQGTLTSEENGKWAWHGSCGDVDEDKLLSTMCNDWLSELSSNATEESTELTEDTVQTFQIQERRRFLYPHQAFVYTINGNRYPVPPVKGSTGPTKEGRVAREHWLLRSERPPQVTLLALTRDAVARMPDGVGTRNDVCKLIHESQYLAEAVTEAQISSAVSGALDRLHYENDPCVKYDAARRMWVYLHADRSIEDLERLHAEQLGAPKRKRNKEKVKKDKHTVDSVPAANSPSAKGGTKTEKVHSHGPTDAPTNHPISNFAPHALGSPAPATIAGEVASEGVTKNATGASSNVSDRPLVAKKKTKKSKADVANMSNISLTSNPGGVTTIQLTQKQLLEMTRKLSSSAAASRAPREVLITHRQPSVVKKVAGGRQDGLSMSPSHVKGRLVHQQNGQPSLKLILKPAADDKEKPTAELVRVLPPGHAQRSAPVNKHHMLSHDQLRRFSDQIPPATSNRSVTIMQQPAAVDARSVATERHLLNLSSPGGSPLARRPQIVVQNESSAGLRAPGPAGVRNSFKGVATNVNADKLYRRIVITTKSDGVTPGGSAVAAQSVPASPQIVHVLSRTSTSPTVSCGPGKTPPLPMQIVKAARPLPAGVQVVQNTSHSVQIITGGKVQTLQVLGAPKSPIMSPQNKPAGNLVISQCQQPLPRSDSPTANVSTRPASACEGT